ncbi:Ras GTPase-activating-like protein IQGAP1 [Lamellibrachia satsuma]|nr:Ras GTPase-activating-like protein IQGAP1 [Lamellibrachia satsuma]
MRYISAQDVVSHHKSLKKYRENSSSSLATAQQLGLRAFTKQSRERLEAYQHLFYLLQTNPVYLAKLIFEVPQSRTTKFMESMILTLYNYASNQREEFLLLRLFETALKEEISSKVDKMSDLVTGNPMVVKMIVGFNRNTQGQGQLRELLNPLVKNIINDRNLLINTNPVDIYKKWVNQTETETGQASRLPYDVTVEQALEYEAVRERIAQSIHALKSSTDMFLESIFKNVDKIPYGMRYMAKVMREALSVKFPQASEKDVLKIVGNLIYYRYINPAIVSPDAFDIIDVSMSKGLSNDQRRNLGSVAKILQFAASNKGFGGDSQHLSVLNPYIIETHKRFKQYFIDVCDVVDPEVRFNVDQYTDVTRVTKPVIYISLSELSNTHKLLLEHQDKIAPDSNDPLHELLEDLGDAPDIELLVGEASSDDDAASKAQMEKTEISLTLSNKFEVPEHEQSDVHSQLIRTKRMLVDVIRCQLTGDNLPQILNCPATEEEENTHQALIQRRDRTDQKAITKTGKLVRNQSIVGDSRLPLETMKEKIRRHLENLEKAGVVSRSDNYQSVINSIVQDIRNQRLYRQRRKQEMVRLRATLKNLAAKRAFFQEQVDYYNQYVKTCLDNLSTKGKKSGRKSMLFKRHSGSATKGSIKYSAAKLHEKGVILEIEGLAINQFKNVLFEISSTETTGVFDVNAKFMGVSMDKVELVFQDLLQLQYEGVAVMPMFDKAKINVNLLIFLLNKKFYGK